jgi:hypothetical protein
MENKKIHVSNEVMALLVNYFFNNDDACIERLYRELRAVELTREEYFNLVAAVNANRAFLEVCADNATNPLVLSVYGVICTSSGRYFIDANCLRLETYGHAIDRSGAETKYVFTNVKIELTDDVDINTVYRYIDEWRSVIENQNDKHMDEEKKTQDNGAFMDSLKRNNKQIRDDRAQAIGEDAEMIYKRKIEDMEITIKRMVRDQDNMLDMSPDNAQSLKLASDFNADEFATKDIELGKNIRNLQIVLNIAKKRYNYLFGHRYDIEEVQ